MSTNSQVKLFIYKTLDKVDIDRQRKIILDQRMHIEEQQKRITDIINNAAYSDKPWIIGEMYWGK